MPNKKPRITRTFLERGQPIHTRKEWGQVRIPADQNPTGQLWVYTAFWGVRADTVTFTKAALRCRSDGFHKEDARELFMSLAHEHYPDCATLIGGDHPLYVSFLTESGEVVNFARKFVERFQITELFKHPSWPIWAVLDQDRIPCGAFVPYFPRP